MALGEDLYGAFFNRVFDAKLTQSFLSADPAAGSEILVTVPGGEYWEVASVSVNLVANANAISRGVTIIVDDGVNILFRSQEPVSHLASETRRYSWMPFMGSVSGGGITLTGNGPFPTFTLQPGWRIRTLTGNFQAGDDYSAAAIVARRFSLYDLAAVALDINSEWQSRND